MRDAAIYNRNNVLWEGDIGLPLPNTERKILNLSKKRVEDVQKIIKSYEPIDDFAVR